ncbi:lysine/ornithine N-monooxygenase [Bradyrhizobium diazoefficiens]
MTTMTPDAAGLAALEARLKQDLAWLELPAKSWVPRRVVDGESVVDVVIVGAGMAGLVASAMLRRLGVDNQLVLDRARAGEEGPWVTFARMRTLRSPKELTGPAMGMPALTFRAFYEAQYGRQAWQALDRAPRTMWMDYLIWYRKVLDLPVRNGVSVERIHARTDELFALDISEGGTSRQILARHVVLATGRDGLGGAYVPSLCDGIDRRFLGAFVRPYRLRETSRQACCRRRRGRIRHGQRSDGAGGGRSAARPLYSARGHPARQQVHRHRQPGRRPRLCRPVG